MLASRVFASSPRLRRLLRHIVEKSVAGDRENLKEYSIGLDVFARDPSFDPKTDSIVRSAARQLRLKLGEYYQSEGRDETVRIELPKGSYVAELIVESKAAPAPRKAANRYLAATAAAMTFVAVATAWGYMTFRHRGPKTIAVLPFTDQSPAKDLEYVSVNLHDGLTSALVGTKGIQVMARASAASLKKDPVEAARTARSQAVITGSVAAQGDQLQIIVSLVDGGSGKYLWSQTFTSAANGLGEVERSAALAVAGALGVSADVPAPALPRNAQALDLYLRASSMSKTRRADRMRAASPLFEQMIALAPDFAPGYAAAATNYLVANANGIMSWESAGPRGMDLARKALQLDPNLADAHDALGLAYEAQWKWTEAREEYSRAIAIDPRYPVSYFRKATNLIINRQFAEAEKTIEMARVLDPSWSAPDGLMGELYYYMHRYDDALDLARRSRDKADAKPFFDDLTARIYLAQGKLAQARPYAAAEGTEYSRALLRAIDGDTRAGFAELVALRPRSDCTDFGLAMYEIYAMHDPEGAMKWLEQSYRDHEPDLVSLAIDPMFDGIRGNRRMKDLLRSMNLEQ